MVLSSSTLTINDRDLVSRTTEESECMVGSWILGYVPTPRSIKGSVSKA